MEFHSTVLFIENANRSVSFDPLLEITLVDVVRIQVLFMFTYDEFGQVES